MLKTRTLAALLLLVLTTTHAAAHDPYSPRKNDHESPSILISLAIPIILPENAVVVLPRYTPVTQDNVPVFLEDCRTFAFDDLPEEYDIWDESLVNPYGVRLVGMPDTIKIDMRGYFPPSKKHVTSDFGFRKGRFHYGIDLKVHKGDTVFCAFDGQVRLTKSQRKGYGQYVVVRHNNGLETLYAHLDKTLVTPGQTVSAGEALGLGGNTGRSTGYHLHFEARYLGNVINPNDLFDFAEGGVKNEVFWLMAAHFEYMREIEKVRFWTVRSGDSLGKIASKTGVSISRLCTLNHLQQTSTLRIGQKIRYS